MLMWKKRMKLAALSLSALLTVSACASAEPSAESAQAETQTQNTVESVQTVTEPADQAVIQRTAQTVENDIEHAVKVSSVQSAPKVVPSPQNLSVNGVVRNVVDSVSSLLLQ